VRDGQRLLAPETAPTAPPSATPPDASAPGTPPAEESTEQPSPGNAPYLQVGDQIRVRQRAHFAFSYAGNVFRLRGGKARLECRSLTLDRRQQGPRMVLSVALESGRLQVRAGWDARGALAVTEEMLVHATASGASFLVSRNPRRRSTRAWSLDRPIVAAEASDERLRITARRSYTAIADARGLRLDIWPFSISRLQRPTNTRDALPPYWADGLPCSVGCTAPGAIPGWPLKPFHRQHAIRAGINELRPANFHVGVDIEARNSQPVYAIQSGYATIRYPGTGDVNVDVGSFYYWHIDPSVSDGQYVVAYKTVIGHVLKGFYHLAFSEGSTSDYLNPLRPGGSLRPYRNSEPPIIGIPRIFRDGRVVVGAFGPQSVVQRGLPYETPVLAPSSLAWRLYDSRNRALTGLEWAMRGSQNYPPGLKSTIFAPGASNPGFECFLTKRRCIPSWVYWLAGGLTRRLPLDSLARGRYRLTVYAWDWAGNTSALDYRFRIPLAHAADSASPEFGPLEERSEFDETG
jgi:murein DD-endopeptidase MepM/ murein hydrolase activator NlpD